MTGVEAGSTADAEVGSTTAEEMEDGSVAEVGETGVGS